MLELTLTPEVYSGLGNERLSLAVRFDPEAALRLIHQASREGWDRNLRDLDDIVDELAAVPVLRYPHWVDEAPRVISDLGAEGYDTAVVLPFGVLSEKQLGLDANRWLAAVRESFEDVTDRILMLLGTFSEVRIEDRLAGAAEVVSPDWLSAEAIGDDVTRELVEVRRNGLTSSRWRLYRRSMPDSFDLAAEVAAGTRLGDGPGQPEILPAVDGQPSSPFHLFFPTWIGSGLPLLLHGYFEVDAARTGFYRGSASRNEAILSALAELAAVAVADTAESGAADLASLVDLVASAPEPEDPRAQQFRNETLARLDGISWVPLRGAAAGAGHGRPPELLTDRQAELARRAGDVFAEAYVRDRTGLRLPASHLTDESLAFLAGRKPEDSPGLWDVWYGPLCL